MIQLPEEPPVPATQRSVARSTLRYEDVSQDGRILPLTLPHGVGVAIWQNLLTEHPVAQTISASGVIPILTRLVIASEKMSVSVRNPLEIEGSYQLAHTVDEEGAVNRILLNMWVSLRAAAGRTYGAPPPQAGKVQLAGRVFAEHVFTKMFAPPAERKVLRLDFDGLAPVPSDRYQWHPPDEMLTLPADAEPLDESLLPDAAPIAFGLVHTDSNQHVNSLVYPRLFQEAALRRLASHRLGTQLMVGQIEMAYRKPCFAGDQVRILVRTFRLMGRLGAVGVFVPEGPSTGTGRPLCTLRVLFTD